MGEQHLHVPDGDTGQHPLAGHDGLQDVPRDALDEPHVLGHRGDRLAREPGSEPGIVDVGEEVFHIFIRNMKWQSWMDSQNGDKKIFADHLPYYRMYGHLCHHLWCQLCQEHVGHNQLTEEGLSFNRDDVQEVGS